MLEFPNRKHIVDSAPRRFGDIAPTGRRAQVNSARVTFYALSAGNSTPEDPAGILRRTHTEPPVDETFGRDMTWHPSEYLRRYYLGHNDVANIGIDEDTAKAILDRWCAKWAEDDQVDGIYNA